MSARSYLLTQEYITVLIYDALARRRAASTPAEQQDHQTTYQNLCEGACRLRRAFAYIPKKGKTMISIELNIDRRSYQRHIEQGEATDEEAIAYLREHAVHALQEFEQYDFLVNAIRHNSSINLVISLQDEYEAQSVHARRHYDQRRA